MINLEVLKGAITLLINAIIGFLALLFGEFVPILTLRLFYGGGERVERCQLR